jgi:tetraacyldisaccharide 4'-kinase
MLSGLAYIYGKVANLRNALYEKGLLRSHDLGARVISVGNLTAGGTGKTPLVAYVATLLAERGEKVCILTRGYGRKNPKSRVLVSDGASVLVGAEEGGDEPVELAAKLLGKASVVADPDRVAAAAWARERLEITTFILDDGFQHRRARRDVDIVCVDATDPFGGDMMLPARRLREPVENLARAGVVVITRADSIENLDAVKSRILTLMGDAGSPISNLKSKISDQAAGSRIFTLTNSISDIKVLNQQANRIVPPVSAQMFAFCGIGNPKNFYDGLERHGIRLAGSRSFADHHRYSRRDFIELESAARAAGTNFLITTSKDAVKLRDMNWSADCFVAEIEVKLDEAARFQELITS